MAEQPGHGKDLISSLLVLLDMLEQSSQHTYSVLNLSKKKYHIFSNAHIKVNISATKFLSLP
jgi:hypothetical protein